MLKLNLQYFGHLMWRTDSLEDPDAGQDWRQEEKGTTEDKMAGWCHQLNGHEFEQAPGVGDGQGSLACCNPWDHKESDTTEQLNWTVIPGDEVKMESRRKDKKGSKGKGSIEMFSWWTTPSMGPVLKYLLGFPDGAVVKNLPATARDARDAGLFPGWEDPLQ